MTFEFIQDGEVVHTTTADSLQEATNQAMDHGMLHGPTMNGWPILLAKITDVKCDGVSIRKGGRS